MVATIDHNLEHGETVPRFQRKVMYHSIPDTVLPAFLASREAALVVN